MADREPRRRKRRRDVKRDDVRFEDQFLTSSKTEIRDSDQEVEEEQETHSPSGPHFLSKVIFVILFSGLIFSMGFIFISLQSTDKGTADSYDVGDVHLEAALHDHSNEGVYDDHSHQDEEQADDHIDHEDEEQADDHIDHEDEDSLEKLIESGMTTLSSFFTTKNDDIEESVLEEVEQTESSFETTQPTPDGSAFDDIKGLVKDHMEQAANEAKPEELEDPFTDFKKSFQDEFSETVDYFVTSQPDDSEPSIQTPETNEVEDEVPDKYEDSNFQSDVSFYENGDITNENDYEIRDELDDIDGLLNKSPEKVLSQSQELLQRRPHSPRAHYIKAQALDKLAEKNRSNKKLEEAIAAYQKVMSLENVPEKLYLLAGRRAADRLRFRGFSGKSVKLLNEMTLKFPQDIDLKKEVAVGYLLIGQNEVAKNVLLDALKHAPDSGFAKVHLGFILKTEDSNYEEAIKYLREGIASKEPGVIDGRFYFHLGDALHRIGKKEEALKVYEEAVKEGLFLSVYQRSLYNVDDLTGKPWWDPNNTRYAPDFKILEKNWKIIRDEALSLMDEKYSGFLPEAEGLQERGNWKQLELFARGRKIEKNCQKAVKTCAIVSQIPEAVSCKRGQIKFSIMHPQTHVWAHTGPTNCRLRSHLGLVVPEGVSIRVADETRKWEEGKVILFDDSFEHEVWHNGSTYRLVLIVDFWHPELSAYQKRSLTPI